MDGLQWKTPIKMDDLGGKPTIFGNTHVGDYTTQVCTDYSIIRDLFEDTLISSIP